MTDYVYVAPDYRIRFSRDGDWFWFVDKDFNIRGKLDNGDWTVRAHDASIEHPTVFNSVPLELVYYETLVSFRKALAIKGLEYIMDKELTLVGEK